MCPECRKIAAMKTWQIFVVGMAALVAALLLPSYESVIAGVGALVVVAVVVVGFLVRPRKEVFYIRTSARIYDPDYAVAVEHDQIAVRIELARLWLLFLPTFGALAFLLVTFARGTTWNFSLWNSSLMGKAAVAGPYPVFLLCRILLVIVLGLLSTWVSERWVLRDAEACHADSVSRVGERVLYSFRDRSGGYYGGEGFPFGLARTREVATIVLYRVSKPDLNKIAMACMFHRLVIAGRGVTDLDEATASAHSARAKISSQPA
jgi:hypothetical protein